MNNKTSLFSLVLEFLILLLLIFVTNNLAGKYVFSFKTHNYNYYLEFIHIIFNILIFKMYTFLKINLKIKV